MKTNLINDFDHLREEQKLFFKKLKTDRISKRIDCLKLLKNKINDKEKEIIKALRTDLGKPSFESYTSEILMVQKELDLFIKNLKSWAIPKRVSGSLLNFPSKDYIIYEPYGTVLMISPWNYPFQLSLIPLIGAIATGNTVVLKPSESAPYTSRLLNKLLGEIFPKNWVQVIEGDAEVAKALLKLKWDYIFFTGSTSVGKIVSKAAAINLTPLTLELGGKSPCVVDGSTNIDKTARRIVFGKFLNCGQTCIAPDYILVKNEIKEQLIEALSKEIEKAFGQDIAQSNDYGRIINKKHFDKLVNNLKDQNIVYGGVYDIENLFFSPTLVLDPPKNSQLYKEEVFGPILSIIGYDTETDIDNVLSELKNPLAFYVFSKREKFIQKLILSYPFGGAVINDSIIHFTNPNLPFGGIGQSGIGAYHGKHSFDLFSHAKPIVKRSFWFDLPQRYAPYPKSLSTLKWILKKI